MVMEVIEDIVIVGAGIAGLTTSLGEHRKVLIETLPNELPERTIRYSSKVVHIHDSGLTKLVYLADGTTLKTKVLIGCGPLCLNIWAFHQGYIECKGGHGFNPEFLQFYGNGVRFVVTPCDDHGVYWYFTYFHSPQDAGVERDPAKMKQFVLSNLGNVSTKIKAVFEQTDLNSMIWSQLKSRHPWELIWGNITKDAACIAGDALHPMTPDIGQGRMV